MAKYKLLAGSYIGADKTQKPNKDGKYPSKTYGVGETFDSDIDLVGLHGYEKFQMVGEGDLKAAPQQASFPHGQVSSGFQADTRVTGPGSLEGGRMEYVAETAHDAKAATEGKPVEAHVVGSQTQDDVEVEEDPGEARAAALGTAEEGGGEGKAHASKTAQALAGTKATHKSEELPANLYTMNLDQLKDYAEKHEVDLKGASRKDDIVKAIRSHKGK